MPNYRQLPVPIVSPRPPDPPPSTPRVGLALSGGGYRAAAFHLGTLTALHELGILDEVAVLSTVSGGSIIGAAWVQHLGSSDPSFETFAKAFSTFLTSATLDVPAILSGALDPFHTDTDKLIAGYDHHLYHGATLASLPVTPVLCINATCLNTGKDWKFYRDVMGDWWFCRNRPAIPDWKSQFYPVRDVSLAVAVAASSCFAPVFAPLILPSKKYFSDQAGTIPYIALADGGIYDNQGLNDLFISGCTHIIASDGSKPFRIEPTPGTGQAVYVTRTSDIMMAKLRGLEFKRALDTGKAYGTPYATLFSLDSILPSEAKNAVARCNIPTRLKALSSQELEDLMTHGHALATDRVTKYLLAGGNGASVTDVIENEHNRIEVLRPTTRAVPR
jgi:NTE family protein